MATRIIILGAPGAGKGTQAKRLAQASGTPHVSTGDIFRAHIENKTSIGTKIEQCINKGNLVPDDLASAVVAQRLAESDCAQGFILDGFPRTRPQAEDLDSLLAERGETLDIVIVLEVDDAELVERLSARRTCPTCGKIYNILFDPPNNEGQCNETDCQDTELVQREDDKEDTIRERLKVYHQTTEPLISFYQAKGLRKSVGGTYLGPDDVALKIEEILTKTGVSQ